MKFVFGFILLVSALVAISPQQFHQQRTGQQWLSQYHQLPRTFLYNQRQPAASLYYEPVDANIPFFRYSRPNIQPALIYPQNEEGSYQGAFDGIPQYYIDNKQSVQQKNQDLLLKQVGQDNEEKKAFTVFPYVRPIAPSAVYSQADGDESIIELLASQNLFADGPSKVGYSRPKLGFQNEDDKLGKIIPVMAQQHMTNQNQMANVKPRIKNFGFYQGLSAGNQQQNARLFYLDGSNLLSKTLTVKVTSTCTTISIVSCIQITNLDPSDPPVPCRRKRSPEVDHALEKDESQFPINPSKVEIVTPTLEPFLSILPHDLIQTPPVEMASSKEETLHNNDESNSLVTYMAKQQREEKAFKFNIQNFLTYTTVTILGSIVTSTLTQTFVPAAALACLPAGYVLCPL
ncbi:LOW QUALITY PROTEIN: uncharacterized protein LOC116921583 [Daphnia magna]|uniref:LOW QUALITY PROTEIN: uncharacterized protein LOC116921583 n=1 Tax=Daphnia magna TaxID=35525 RepID=UPI001E1BD31C|nr:LOW QUALITY PROTEIN: uncharacterized protein LOC116921583 [Daphnia magna]